MQGRHISGCGTREVGQVRSVYLRYCSTQRETISDPETGFCSRTAQAAVISLSPVPRSRSTPRCGFPVPMLGFFSHPWAASLPPWVNLPALLPAWPGALQQQGPYPRARGFLAVPSTLDPAGAPGPMQKGCAPGPAPERDIPPAPPAASSSSIAQSRVPSQAGWSGGPGFPGGGRRQWQDPQKGQGGPLPGGVSDTLRCPSPRPVVPCASPTPPPA